MEGGMLNNLEAMTNKAKEIFESFGDVIEVIGTGVGVDADKPYIFVWVYYKHKNYLSLLIDDIDGYKVEYEFTEYPTLL
jgi:hypothetical protein